MKNDDTRKMAKLDDRENIFRVNTTQMLLFKLTEKFAAAAVNEG